MGKRAQSKSFIQRGKAAILFNVFENFAKYSTII